MARKSLKPQLNQIRTWVREGRTDAWIAHKLEVSVQQIAQFKRENELAPEGDEAETGAREEIDLRAEDDALIAAELEKAAEDADAEAARKAEAGEDDDDGDSGDEDEAPKPKPRRSRRGGRRRGKAAEALEGTFDHGEDGYGLWLDPAVQDDPIYAEHWAGHRPVTVKIEDDQIVITRAGDGDADDE
jgi:hypothetical protein